MPSLSLEDLLEECKIELDGTQIHLPELVIYDQADPESQSSNLFEKFNLPTINEGDDHLEKLKKINTILEVMNKEGILSEEEVISSKKMKILSTCTDCNDSFNNNNLTQWSNSNLPIQQSNLSIQWSNNLINDLMNSIIKICNYKDKEQKYDEKEIEIARKYEIVNDEHRGMTIEELEERLREIKETSGTKEYRELWGEIRNNKQWEHLGCLRRGTEGIWMKENLKQLLGNSEEYWHRIIYRVLVDGVTRVEDLGEELEMNRVEILKMIYNLNSKGILSYDRINDAVYLEGHVRGEGGGIL